MARAWKWGPLFRHTRSPFGLRPGGLSSTSGVENRHRYNGKELHDELGLGWYDYGFRWYDPAVARFVSVDPLAEKFPELTTYQYASNDPISGVDLDGLEKMDFRLAQKFGGLAFDLALKAAASTTQAAKFHKVRTSQTDFNFMVIPRELNGAHGQTQIRNEINMADYASGYGRLLLNTKFVQETFKERKQLIIIEIDLRQLNQINDLMAVGDFEGARERLIKVAEPLVHESFHGEDYSDGENEPQWVDHRIYFDATESEIPEGSRYSLSKEDVMQNHPNSISGQTYREVIDLFQQLDLEQIYKLSKEKNE